MNIIIDNYKIESLPAMRNLMLSELKTVKNKETGAEHEKYIFIGYYGKLDWALNALLELKIKQSNIQSLVELKELIVGFKTTMYDMYGKLSLLPTTKERP